MWYGFFYLFGIYSGIFSLVNMGYDVNCFFLIGKLY